MIEDIKQGVRATVGAIIEKGNKVLLIKRNTEPFKDYWSLPGGHIDFGEEAKTAIIREVKEETGLNIKDPKFITYRDEIYPEINWHGEVLIFQAKAEGEERIDNEEISGIKWLDIDEASKMGLAFNHEELIKIWRNKND